MDPQKFKRVEEIYNAVLELDPEQRDSYIDRSCGDDDELRQEVVSLLSFEKPFDSLIDSPPESLAAQMMRSQVNVSLNGRKINQYEIVSAIGEGGMGKVYLANDTRLERRVAVKFLSPEFAGNAERRNRFFQEAKAASALNHPNIITVYDIGEFESSHYIVSELIAGPTLHNYISQEKPSLEKLLDIALQVGSALQTAHEAGIVHRDVKPDNVMIRKDGIVKVLDFGLAKVNIPSRNERVDAEGATRAKPVTVPGMVMGTPQYMSPEQARGQAVDHRSDIFSFGVMLYEMIAGKRPFNGVNDLDTIGSILRDEPEPLSEIVSGLSPELEHIVKKSLRKDPDQRYQSVKDLLTDLNEVRRTSQLNTKLIYTNQDGKPRDTVHTTTSLVTERRFSFMHVGGLLLAFGVAVGGLIWLAGPYIGLSGSAPGAPKIEEVATWASSPGETLTRGTLSPDGKIVAFTSSRSGTRNVWIKQATSGEPVQVTKDEFRNENPVWSPNGDELAFYSERGGTSGIWKIPYLGGNPSRVADLPDGSSRLKGWGKSGNIYYESRGMLYSVDPTTGTTKQLDPLVSAEESVASISISSDERMIAFAASRQDTWSIWIKPVSSGPARELTKAEGVVLNSVWHPDGKRLLYSSRVGATYQIFVVNVEGSAPPRQVTSSDQDAIVLDVSVDGRRVLYASAKEEADIWNASLAEKKETALTSDIASDMWPDVSPDGKSLLYQSIKNLNQGNKLYDGAIMAKSLIDNADPQRITDRGTMPIWSPDGSRVAFLSQTGTKYQIETVNSMGGDRKTVTDTEVTSFGYTPLPYHSIRAATFDWAPDSARIAYVSTKEAVSNIYLANADGSGNSQLTNNPDDTNVVDCPLWSPDGRFVAFSSKTNFTDRKTEFSLKVIDVTTKTIKELYTQSSPISLVGWGASGKEIIAKSVPGSPYENMHKEISLMKIEVESGKATPITKLSNAYLFNIHLSPDKKQIAFTTNTDRRDNLWIIASSGGEPRKITENNDPRFYFSSLAWAPDGNNIYYGKQSRYTLILMMTNFE